MGRQNDAFSTQKFFGDCCMQFPGKKDQKSFNWKYFRSMQIQSSDKKGV